MSRTAEDDLRALLTAEAVEKGGGTIISITFDGRAKYQTALDNHSRFIIWARVKDKAHINKIDNLIEARFKKAQLGFHSSYPTD
jgi:hypothetical protein